MTKYLAVALGIALLATAGLGWLLKGSYERNGELEQANTQLTKTLENKANATRSRANTERANRQLPPAGVLDKLR